MVTFTERLLNPLYNVMKCRPEICQNSEKVTRFFKIFTKQVQKYQFLRPDSQKQKRKMVKEKTSTAIKQKISTETPKEMEKEVEASIFLFNGVCGEETEHCEV